MNTTTHTSHNKWLVLISVAMFTFMATLDGSIINIAIPTISKSLSVPMNQAVWIISIYIVIICIFLLLFGKLADMIGKAKIFKIGTIIFVLGSFLCGIKVNLAFLLFARVVQALGASMTMSTNFGIITEVFPENQRGRALGILGSFVSLGSIAGPGLGGILLAHLDWSYIFWVNIPVGIFAIALGAKYLPKSTPARMGVIDWPGFFLFAATITVFFTTVFLGQEIGFARVSIISLIILAGILLSVFVKVENKTDNPLVDFNVFKNKLFTIGLLCAFFVFMANSFFTVLMPFYLQETLGLSVSYAGMILMSLSFVMMFATPISGAISDKVGREILTFIGLVVMGMCQIALSLLNAHTPISLFIGIIITLGIGNALFQSPNSAIVMSSVPKHELGMAGGLNSLARNLGMICGIALSTTSLYAMMSFKAGYHVSGYIEDAPELFVFGMSKTFLISFLIMVIASALTGYRLFHHTKLKNN